MLYRGETPLSPAEVLDYEIERELRQMEDEGLVMEGTGEDGLVVWTKTLRGSRYEPDSEHVLATRVRSGEA